MPPPDAPDENQDRLLQGWKTQREVSETDGEPPLADAIDSKRGRVMVNADTYPTRIGGEVVDPVRHRATELLDQEVMDPDFFRVALGAILAARIAEIADQFFFLVSTQITGCCSATAVVTWVLM